jgi:hypothetical protein
MTDRARSAVSRTPLEIWWMILDEVIDCPVHFATVYHGEDWANDSRTYAHAFDETEYKEKRTQRLIIASVCKTWKQFSTQRMGRSLLLENNKKLQDPYRVKLKKARRVFIRGTLHEDSLSLIGQEANWEILKLGPTDVEQINRISLPHLRRLIFASRKLIRFDPGLYLKGLGSLVNLTWLQLSLSFFTRPPPPMSESANTIFLPKLQVLIYRTYRHFCFPFGTLNLPSLQHLSVKSDQSSTAFPPINNFLLPYCKTLKSVSMTFTRDMGDEARFLQWNELPNLLELVLDGPSLLRFHPLPHDHPLKRFYVRYWDTEEICSWMDSNNLRQIRLLDAKWDHGALNNRNGTQSISSSDVERLLEKAESRGISFEASEVANMPPTKREHEDH